MVKSYHAKILAQNDVYVKSVSRCCCYYNVQNSEPFHHNRGIWFLLASHAAMAMTANEFRGKNQPIYMMAINIDGDETRLKLNSIHTPITLRRHCFHSLLRSSSIQ